MNKNELKEKYKERYDKYLYPISNSLEVYVRDCVNNYPRIDRVVARAKGIDSFIDKAFEEEDGILTYHDPLNQIQDQIGVRIICFYKSDVPLVQKIVKDYFALVEEEKIVPENESQFGYEGVHYILIIPDDFRNPSLQKDECTEFFELQIKTLYQHAWSEANHDLSYKTEEDLTREQLRKIAFTAAQSWGADRIFNELAISLISDLSLN